MSAAVHVPAWLAVVALTFAWLVGIATARWAARRLARWSAEDTGRHEALDEGQVRDAIARRTGR